MPYAKVGVAADDICYILSLALLADGDLDAPELRALDGLHIDRALGIPQGRFRAALNKVCHELMSDDPCGHGLSVLEPERIGEAMRLLHDVEHRFASTTRLIELMHDGDPVQLECKLRDPVRLDAALGRVVDPQLRLWTCTVLLHLMNADGELHRNEIAVLEHVLDRWQITPDALRAAFDRVPS